MGCLYRVSQSSGSQLWLHTGITSICIYLGSDLIDLRCGLGAFQLVLVVKNMPTKAGGITGEGSVPGWEDPLESA